MAFDGKNLYYSAMVDKDSFYPRIETGYYFTADKDQELFNNFIKELSLNLKFKQLLF